MNDIFDFNIAFELNIPNKFLSGEEFTNQVFSYNKEEDNKCKINHNDNYEFF